MGITPAFKCFGKQALKMNLISIILAKCSFGYNFVFKYFFIEMCKCYFCCFLILILNWWYFLLYYIHHWIMFISDFFLHEIIFFTNKQRNTLPGLIHTAGKYLQSIWWNLLLQISGILFDWLIWCRLIEYIGVTKKCSKIMKITFPRGVIHTRCFLC